MCQGGKAGGRGIRGMGRRIFEKGEGREDRGRVVWWGRSAAKNEEARKG